MAVGPTSQPLSLSAVTAEDGDSSGVLGVSLTLAAAARVAATARFTVPCHRGNEPAAHRAARGVQTRRPHTTTLVKSRHVAGELSRAARARVWRAWPLNGSLDDCSCGQRRLASGSMPLR